jgi:hypothetical protein
MMLLVSSSHTEVGPAVDDVVDKNDGHDGHDVHDDDSITTTTTTTTTHTTNTTTATNIEDEFEKVVQCMIKLVGRILMVGTLLFTIWFSWAVFKSHHPTDGATDEYKPLLPYKILMMNRGGLPYTISNAPNYDTEQLSQRYKYFDVYSLPIQSVYSQVHWTSHGSIPLPLHIIQRFQNGTVMALMGYEVDQVRNDPITGQEVSVPITWTYNHHYMAVSKVTTVLPVVGTVIR